MRGPARGEGDGKAVNLALQGGGSHGAYAWGVLDALIEDDRIEIGAISGASAGAFNAVVYADGLAEGGRKSAREKLEKLWLSVSTEGSLAPAQRKLLRGVAQALGRGLARDSSSRRLGGGAGAVREPLRLNPPQLQPAARRRNASAFEAFPDRRNRTQGPRAKFTDPGGFDTINRNAQHAQS